MGTPRNCCSPLNVIKPQRSTACCLPPLPDFQITPIYASWTNNDQGTFPVPTLIEGGPENWSITFNDNNPSFFGNVYYSALSSDIETPILDISIKLPTDNFFDNGTSLFEYYTDTLLLKGCGLDADASIYKGINYIQNDGIYGAEFTYTAGQTLRYKITATDQTVYLDDQILSYHIGTDFDNPVRKLELLNTGPNYYSNDYLYRPSTWIIKITIPPLITSIVYPPKVVGLIGNCYVRRPDRNNVSESQRMLRQQCSTVIINKETKTVVSAVPLDVSAISENTRSASVTTSQTRDAVLLAFENNPAMRFNEFLGPLPPANPCPPPFFNAGVPKPSVIGCGPGTIKPFSP